ncbi:MAG: hypothetical protein L0154_01410 [Chloroflexi bacterium]|nr:hypothetical protein [Chloroflexota bacterium]
MEWLDKSQEMIKSWMDSTEKMWKQLTDSVEMPTAGAWNKALKTWEHSFNNFVETQALWMRMAMRNASSSANIEGMDEFVKSMEEMTNNFVEMQKSMWGSWFSLVKNMNPESMTDEMKAQAQKGMDAWKDGMQKVIEAQQSLVDMVQKSDKN